jgi:SPP1 family predicted phage head-tail adaptor
VSRNIGPLTERLTVQTRTATTDTQGGRSVAWSTLATVWAALESFTAAERLQAQAIGSQQGLRFRVRRRLDVTPSMRVSWTPTFPPNASARTLEIHGVAPVDDGRTWMRLECGEVS